MSKLPRDEEAYRHSYRWLRHHEPFWAFLALLICIMGMMFVASSFDHASVNDVTAQAKIRIIDSTVTGLVAILGMAAQALFRINQADKDIAAAAKTNAEKIPPETGEAREAMKEDQHDLDKK